MTESNASDILFSEHFFQFRGLNLFFINDKKIHREMKEMEIIRTIIIISVTRNRFELKRNIILVASSFSKTVET